MKTSSRSGRFKKKLIDHDLLQLEVPKFLNIFNKSLELYAQGKLSAPELCAHYIIISMSIRHPGTWAGSKIKSLNINHELHSYIPDYVPLEPNIQRRIHNLSIGDIFNQFSFKSTPLSVNRAVLNYSTGNYPLELMFNIPTPRQVLNQQKTGRRCLTLITKEKQMKEFILGERDYLGFCLHDLIHADHFYDHNLSFEGQLGMYRFLDTQMDLPLFRELCRNAEFEAEFEYVIADMNAYPIHLLKCLKSAMEFYGSKEQFNTWAAQFNIGKHLIALNTQSYEPLNEDHILIEWLISFTKE